MPLTATAIPLPITLSTTPTHPALQFFTIYGQNFPKTEEQWNSQPWEEFYSADCKTYKVDQTIIEGGEESWEFFRRLYAMLPKLDRDLISMIIVSDDERGTHAIHTVWLTRLPAYGGKRTVELPQAFVHTLGKADEGKGTMGMQIRELRNYYDYGVWERAAKSNH